MAQHTEHEKHTKHVEHEHHHEGEKPTEEHRPVGEYVKPGEEVRPHPPVGGPGGETTMPIGTPLSSITDESVKEEKGS